MLIRAILNNLPYTYQLIAFLAAISFFSPLFIVFVRKLGKYPAFVWLTLYWALAGAINLLFMIESFAISRLGSVVERVYNLADAPIMLFVLYKAVQIEKVQDSIKKMLPAFLCAVLLLTVFTGLQRYAEIVMVGCGLLIILIYIIWIIVHYISGVKLSGLEQAQQFIYYALLFEYGVSVITFVFNYLVPEQRNVQDSFLIYHVSVIISVAVASYGLIRYRLKSNHQKTALKPYKKEREAEITFL